MSWRDKWFLGFGLVVILSFWSCEDPNQIGLPLQSDTSKIKVYYKEIQLPTSVIQNDSVLTSFSQWLLSGNYSDENFGSLDITSFTQVIPGNQKLQIPDTAIFDSLILTLNIKYSYGAGVALEQIYNIHQLSEQLDKSTPYFTYSSVQYNPEIIGSIHFAGRESADTVMTIKIDQSFGQKFFNDLLDSTIVNQDSGKTFINYFKGLAITADESNNSVIGFDTRSLKTALTVYYKLDTIPHNYIFSMAFGVNFNQILDDRTGTALQGIHDLKYKDYYPPDGKSYLQSGTGTVIKIDLTPILDYIDSIPKLVINKAIIDIEGEPVTKYTPAPSSIFLYYADSSKNNENRRVRYNGYYQGVLDEGATGLANPVFTENIQGYSLPATVFSEAVIKGAIPFHQLLIYPPEASYTQSINQFIVNVQNVKFKFYYTTVTK